MFLADLYYVITLLLVLGKINQTKGAFMMVEINDAVADEIKQTASENQPSNFIIGLVEKTVDTEVKATTTNVIKIGNFIIPQNATRLLDATTVAAVDTPTVAVVQQNHDAMQVQITHKNKIISFNCTIFCKILPKTKKPRKCVTYRLPLMGKACALCMELCGKKGPENFFDG